MVKKLGLAIVGITVLGLSAGCVCLNKDHKRDIGLLKQQKWEAEEQSKKLKGDVVQLTHRCEFLIQELRKSSMESEKMYEPKMPFIHKENGVLAKKLGSKGLETVIREGNPAVVVSDLFNAGSTTLSDAGKKKLKEAGEIIKTEAGTFALRIDGYTDNTPIQKATKYQSNETTLPGAGRCGQGIPGQRLRV